MAETKICLNLCSIEVFARLVKAQPVVPPPKHFSVPVQVKTIKKKIKTKQQQHVSKHSKNRS